MSSLPEFFARYMSPMEWGRDDCSLIIADWWVENHPADSDPAANLRGAYLDECGKAEIVNQAGGLLRLVSGLADRVGARRVMRPVDGDFGVVRIADAMFSAIFVAGFAAVRSDDGMSFVRDFRVLRAWSIGGRVEEWIVPQPAVQGRSWLAPSPSYVSDPLSIGVAVLVNLGYGGAISGLGATLLGSAILGAGAIGLSLASSLIFQPPARRPPDPSERQITVRQSVGARVRYYGRVKVAGTLWFFENKNGYLYTGTTLNEGKILGVAEYWLADAEVVVNDAGFVLSAPYYRNADEIYAQIIVKDGSADQTVISEFLAVFPEITHEHRNRGIALGLTIFQETSSDLIPEVWPNLNPAQRFVIDASLVKSVLSGESDIHSNNAADVIYDYLTAVDGAGFPYGAGFLESQVDLPSFQVFASVSDEPVPIRAGGTVRRWMINGGYGLNEEQRQVLPRMLQSCDADLYLTNQGKIAIRGGQWVPPVLTIDDSHIKSAQFRRGAQSQAEFNELVITYVEPELDYQEVEGQSWIDTDNVALRGRTLSQRLDLPMVTNHSQARRAGKIYTHKNNPEWSGKIITDFYGFNAINEQVMTLRYSPLQIDQTFLIRKIVFLPDMTGVEITLTSLSASAYSWDYALEEGNGPATPPDTSESLDLPPPEDFAVIVKQRTVSGDVVGLYIEASWTEPERAALGQQVQYRLSPSGDWFFMSVSDSVGMAESGLLSEGEDYDVRIATTAPAGTVGPWSDPPLTINAS